MPSIKSVLAREILDSRGNPTIEVDITLADGSFGRASVPSGASTGEKEAMELRDGDPKYFHGKGVSKAIGNVNQTIRKEVVGKHFENQKTIDELLIHLDGTQNKSRLGANAILGVSMAFARAIAESAGIPLYQYFSQLSGQKPIMPVPMFNVLNGGVHADNSIDLQEFMIAPVGASSFRDAVRMGADVYHSLKGVLKKSGYVTSVGDEGGFAPNLKSNEEALERIMEAIHLTGLIPGKDIVFALDPASSEFYHDNVYQFKKSNSGTKTSDEMIEFYKILIDKYPIVSLEDGLAETDLAGWKCLTLKLNKIVQLVGDDIFVTNPKIISDSIKNNIGNASLIKLNQIGTVTETLEAMRISREAGYGLVISHRSGETPDDFIADFAVGTAAGQIKTGAPARGERIAKYNQLMRIEKELGTKAIYSGISPFKGTKYFS